MTTFRFVSVSLAIASSVGVSGCKRRMSSTLRADLGTSPAAVEERERGAAPDEVTLNEMLVRVAKAPDQEVLLAGLKANASDGAFALTDESGAESLARVGDISLVEGDLLMPKSGENGAQLNLAVTNEKTWPHGIVPYAIPPNIDPGIRANLLAAMTHIEAKTNVRFAEFRPSWHEHYLSVMHDSQRDSTGTCASELGFQSMRPQLVWAGARCSRGALIHELGHALSLGHEHNRRERDESVTIHWDNIQDGEAYNFAVHGRGYINKYGTNRGDYDFDSIMHYGSSMFCKRADSGGCVGPTITRKDGSLIAGVSNSLSPGDAMALNGLYPEDHPFSFAILSTETNSPTALDIGTAAGGCRAHGYMLPWPEQLPALAAKWRDKIGGRGCIWSDFPVSATSKTRIAWSYDAGDKKVIPEAERCFTICAIDHGALREPTDETKETLVVGNDEQNGGNIKVPVKPRSGAVYRFPISVLRKAELVDGAPRFRGECTDGTPPRAFNHFTEVTIERGGGIVYTFDHGHEYSLDPAVKDYTLVVAIRAYKLDCAGELEMAFKAWN